MRVHYNFYPGRSADGMSIDSAGKSLRIGRAWASSRLSETLDTKTGIYVISPKGKSAEVHSDCGGLHHQ